MTELVMASWEWVDAPDLGEGWYPPQQALCLGALDPRSLPQCATLGGPGVFSYRDSVAIAGGIALGRRMDAVLTTTQKDAIRLQMRNPFFNSNTVLDALWDLFTIYADPKGLTGPKPLMPTRAGNLDLHVIGFSQVRQKRLHQQLDEWPIILQSLQDQYRRVRISYGLRTAQKFLGGLAEKYHLPYKIFIPSDMRDEGVLLPETTITESFNQTDSTTLGPDLTWTEVKGDFDTVSNEANSVTATGRMNARAESDLSTDDQYSEADCRFLISSTTHTGVIVREDTNADATNDHYSGNSQDNTANTDRIEKVVDATQSNLADGGDTAPGDGPHLLRLEVDGSSLTYKRAGVTKLGPITDTAITGSLRCGIGTRGHNGADRAKWDNFEAGDLAATGLSVRLAGEGGLAGVGGLAGRRGGLAG